jgi:hypothetical protein
MLVCFSSVWAQDVQHSPVRNDTAADSSGYRNPRTALFLSVVPGLGQLYNRDYLKAAVVVGAFSLFSYRWSIAADDYRNAPGDEILHRRRNDQAWLMGLTWTLSLLDAFIDAQLSDSKNYDIDDSKIPVIPDEQKREGTIQNDRD